MLNEATFSLPVAAVIATFVVFLGSSSSTRNKDVHDFVIVLRLSELKQLYNDTPSNISTLVVVFSHRTAIPHPHHTTKTFCMRFPLLWLDGCLR